MYIIITYIITLDEVASQGLDYLKMYCYCDTLLYVNPFTVEVHIMYTNVFSRSPKQTLKQKCCLGDSIQPCPDDYFLKCFAANQHARRLRVNIYDIL